MTAPAPTPARSHAKRKLGHATKCRHADAYKAMKPPTCGCDVCKIKWLIAELARRVYEANWI